MLYFPSQGPSREKEVITVDGTSFPKCCMLKPTDLWFYTESPFQINSGNSWRLTEFYLKASLELISIYMYTHIHICTYTHIHTHLCIHIYGYIYILTYWKVIGAFFLIQEQKLKLSDWPFYITTCKFSKNTYLCSLS